MATRGTSDITLSCHRICRSAATVSNSLRKAGRSKPSGHHSTRMKKRPASSSWCWSARTANDRAVSNRPVRMKLISGPHLSCTSLGGERISRTAQLTTLIEDDGFIAVSQNAVVEVPLHCPREHRALDIPALFDQSFHLIAVRYAQHVLFDNRAVVKRRGDVMAGGADELHPAPERRVVRPRSHKGGQERMVYIDDAAGILRHEFRRKDLHVPREHDEVDALRS